MSGRADNLRIKSIFREITGLKKVRASTSKSGWLTITIAEPISEPHRYAVEDALIRESLIGTYIGDFTPDVQPRLPCCSFVFAP